MIIITWIESGFPLQSSSSLKVPQNPTPSSLPSYHSPPFLHPRLPSSFSSFNHSYILSYSTPQPLSSHLCCTHLALNSTSFQSLIFLTTSYHPPPPGCIVLQSPLSQVYSAYPPITSRISIWTASTMLSPLNACLPITNPVSPSLLVFSSSNTIITIPI